MKKILGLDLGTNSIGWALVEHDFENKQGKILGMGSRIIPMSQDILGNFDAGNSVSQTAERTRFRSTRRLRERHLLRRARLHQVLNILGFLPGHYANKIDFENHFGQFVNGCEPKLPFDEKVGKYVFLFQNSFKEMIADFTAIEQNVKIPYDWTIYYLRKKALTQKITKEELAWVILNFNQKRGYYQLRGEDEEKTDVREYVQSLKIIAVEKVEQDKKSNQKNWYKMTLENGWEYSATFTTDPNWLNNEKEFLITEELDENGNIKIVKDKKSERSGKEKRRITPLPSFEEINLMSKEQQDKIYKKIKARTEITISDSGTTVGTYIYKTLLQNPKQKIRGKLVRTIERSFYRKELEAILRKQIELQPELFTEEKYCECVRELYRSNKERQDILMGKSFVDLLVNDIIFYQRPLRSQKSTIVNCILEYRIHKDKDGNEVKEYLKGIPKSHPYYQEFRIWQWLYNLKIYTREEDEDVTARFIKDANDIEKLFEFLMTKKEISNHDVITFLITPRIKAKFPDAKASILNKEIAREISNYRWNYVFDSLKEKEEDKSKRYPCNETGYEIRRRLEKVENAPADFLSIEKEYNLWHIIYSVSDKIEFEKALKTFAQKNNLNEVSFVENFRNFKPFKSEYGSFSEKAIKKLLPLMRLGKFWNYEAIDDNTKSRISKIITGEYDEKIKDHVREKAINLIEKEHFQGLPLWLTQYIVYDWHSESNIAGTWKTVADLEQYLNDYKQYSLRNPVVEQVVTETLRIVRDIWKQHGHSAENFFNEIHIELGREMKNTAEDRAKITKQVSDNENTNLRIKALLVELKNDAKDIRPYSPVQQEIMKIYEDGVINSGIEIPDDILKISKTPQPSKSDLTRYKLWLEQKYRSPYTGQPITLGELFTPSYEIEHIIPKSRYFDDSINNKVICEAAVNKLKDRQLGFKFIKNNGGQIVETGFGGSVKILDEENYKKFVVEHYSKNRSKRINLLLDEIPDKMIERQMNDTRYISKYISNLLSNIVRADANDDGINSKNLVPGNGKITSTLKQDWGLNDIWNDLILPRFERMNQKTDSNLFTAWNEQYQKFLPTVPLELSKGFQKKRIDHRHHAMDALVIACATLDHVNLLNNQHAKSENSRYDLQNKLRFHEKWTDNYGKERVKFTQFKKPWNNFADVARNELGKIIISFKQNLRVINKATNHYKKYDSTGKKVNEEQIGTNWAIRKPLHKDTVFAKVSLRKVKKVSLKDALNDWKMIVDKPLKVEIKRLIALYEGKFDADKINKYFKDRKYQFREVDVSKVEIYYFETDKAAVRKPLDTSFTESKIKESITDTGIQKILLNHLATKEYKSDLAFSPEGIEEMNKNIIQLNGGKQHRPILKIRVYETIGNKFQVGQTGNKKDKYVEAAKGTNLFFAVYTDENGSRLYETIPLNIVIERLKQGLNAVPETNAKGHNLLFHLSPNDLVYVPTKEQLANNGELTERDIIFERIYKLTDSSDMMANFIPATIANVIFNYNKDKQKRMGINYPIQNEIGIGSQGSKSENTITGEQIKKVCRKLNIDRLGNIKLASR